MHVLAPEQDKLHRPCMPVLLALAQANATLTQQLGDSGHLLSALREETAELASQLAAAQASLAAKDKLVQQLRGMVGAAGGLRQKGQGLLNLVLWCGAAAGHRRGTCTMPYRYSHSVVPRAVGVLGICRGCVAALTACAWLHAQKLQASQNWLLVGRSCTLAAARPPRAAPPRASAGRPARAG